MKFEDYPIEIAPLPKAEGGGYLVTVPDLPGCVADGDTIESAVAEARDAFDAWARAEREDAGALPAPATPNRSAQEVPAKTRTPESESPGARVRNGGGYGRQRRSAAQAVQPARTGISIDSVGG